MLSRQLNEPQQKWPAIDSRIVEPNLVFTADDLRVLKSYANRCSDLPDDDQSILDQFNASARTLGPEFIAAVLEFNTRMSAHARTWPALEDASQLLGDQLEVASRGVVANAERFQALIESTEAWKRFGAKAEEILNVEADARSPGDELSETDQGVKVSLLGFLELLGQQVENYQVKVSNVYELAREFRSTLEYSLVQELDTVVERANKLGVSDHLADLAAKVTQLDTRIKEGNESAEYYQGILNYSWVLLVLGRAIAEVAVSADLRSIQASLEAWKHEQHNYASRIESLNAVQRKVSEYLMLMADLRLRLMATEQAAGRLSRFWSKVKSEIDISSDELSLISHDSPLVVFASQFKNTIAPWREVNERSVQLKNVFDQFSQSERSSF